MVQKGRSFDPYDPPLDPPLEFLNKISIKIDMHAALILFQHYAKFFEHPITITPPLNVRNGEDDFY